MGVVTWIVRLTVPILFVLGGRWIQLNPERTVPKGYFTGSNTLGARIHRFQIAALGTFAVFAGTTGTVFSIVSPLAFAPAALGWMTRVTGIMFGIIAAIHVRKEAKAKPTYVSTTPFGWWP